MFYDELLAATEPERAEFLECRGGTAGILL